MVVNSYAVSIVAKTEFDQGTCSGYSLARTHRTRRHMRFSV